RASGHTGRSARRRRRTAPLVPTAPASSELHRLIQPAGLRVEGMAVLLAHADAAPIVSIHRRQHLGAVVLGPIRLAGAAAVAAGRRRLAEARLLVSEPGP